MALLEWGEGKDSREGTGTPTLLDFPRGRVQLASFPLLLAEAGCYRAIEPYTNLSEPPATEARKGCSLGPAPGEEH